jgi:dolichol-phosphate mannosyltransferase
VTSRTAKKFALIVPTLNEAENIQVVLDRIIQAMSQSSMPWEVLVVDDESSDGTREIVKSYSTRESRVRLVSRQGNRGLAGAITHGWTQTDAALLGVIDADLQHPPELLQHLLNEINNGFDLVIASRYVRPHSMDDWNTARRMFSRLSVLASKLVQRKDLRVKDPLSGYFILHRECIEGLSFQSAGFKLLLEILAKGHVRSVSEVPFKFAPRHGGSSKAGTMTAVHYVRLLWKLSLDEKPSVERDT